MMKTSTLFPLSLVVFSAVLAATVGEQADATSLRGQAEERALKSFVDSLADSATTEDGGWRASAGAGRDSSSGKKGRSGDDDDSGKKGGHGKKGRSGDDDDDSGKKGGKKGGDDDDDDSGLECPIPDFSYCAFSGRCVSIPACNGRSATSLGEENPETCFAFCQNQAGDGGPFTYFQWEVESGDCLCYDACSEFADTRAIFFAIGDNGACEDVDLAATCEDTVFLGPCGNQQTCNNNDPNDPNVRGLDFMSAQECADECHALTTNAPPAGRNYGFFVWNSMTTECTCFPACDTTTVGVSGDNLYAINDDMVSNTCPLPDCSVGDTMDGGLEFGEDLASGRIIFGRGNADGGFTKATAMNIELALRGKLRFDDASCQPQNQFNQIDNTAGYNFGAGNPDSCTGNNDDRPTWSFEFSINSDIGCNSVENGASCTPLNAYDYHLQLDDDRTYCTDFDWTTSLTAGTFDPINVGDSPVIFPDHAIGTTGTEQGVGSTMATSLCEDPSGTWTCPDSRFCNVAPERGGCLGGVPVPFNTAVGQYTIAQNSLQLQFFRPPMFNFEDVGIYTFKLAAKQKGTDTVIVETYIDIIVGVLGTDFPDTVDNCDNDFSYGGIFDSLGECQDFATRYGNRAVITGALPPPRGK